MADFGLSAYMVICSVIVSFIAGYQFGVSGAEHRQAMKDIDEMNARLRKEF
jgi:hypothetical protein